MEGRTGKDPDRTVADTATGMPLATSDASLSPPPPPNDGMASFFALMAKHCPATTTTTTFPSQTTATAVAATHVDASEKRPPPPPPSKKPKAKSGDKRKREVAELDVKGVEGKDTRDADRKLLLNSKVIAEEKSANKTHIADACFIPDDTSWITSDQMNSALCHQIKSKIDRRAKPMDWYQNATYRLLHPQPWPMVLRALTTAKHPLNICIQNPTPIDYIFLPVNVDIGGKSAAGEKGNHWVMLFIDSVRRIVTYWDPFGKPMIHDESYARLRQHFAKYEFYECPVGVQANGYQCGMWVVFGLVRCYIDVCGGYLQNNPNARFDPTRSCDLLKVHVVNLLLPVNSDWKHSAMNNALVASYRSRVSMRMKQDIASGKFSLADLELD